MKRNSQMVHSRDQISYQIYPNQIFHTLLGWGDLIPASGAMGSRGARVMCECSHEMGYQTPDALSIACLVLGGMTFPHLIQGFHTGRGDWRAMTY